MKRFRITYQPFPQSDVTASDIVVYAENVEKVQEKFNQEYSHCSFVSAKEE